jgi:hypothetical protein
MALFRQEQLDNGKFREVPTNEPAPECENARLDQLGPWRQANVAAGQAAVALKLVGIDSDADTPIVAARAGTIVGIAWDFTAAPTAGAASLQATNAGTAGGDVVSVVGAQTGVVDLAAPQAFARGDKLGLKVTTNGGFLPITTDLMAWLVVKWAQ